MSDTELEERLAQSEEQIERLSGRALAVEMILNLYISTFTSPDMRRKLSDEISRFPDDIFSRLGKHPKGFEEGVVDAFNNVVSRLRK